MLRKKLNVLVSVAAISVALVACQKKDKNSPGYEYMPDMYRSPAYKANEFNAFLSASTNLLPADGSIAHSFDREKSINFFPYPFSETARDSAALYLKSPLAKSEFHLAEGKRLYEIFCAACHGTGGMGDGPVVKVLEARDNLGLKPQPYNSELLKVLSEGSIFHTTQYGKGLMGSYASQVSAYERWQIVQYVQTLQNPATTEAASADSSVVAIADTTK